MNCDTHFAPFPDAIKMNQAHRSRNEKIPDALLRLQESADAQQQLQATVEQGRFFFLSKPSTNNSVQTHGIRQHIGQHIQGVRHQITRTCQPVELHPKLTH